MESFWRKGLRGCPFSLSLPRMVAFNPGCDERIERMERGCCIEGKGLSPGLAIHG
jgi:hypothetical protein